MSVTPIRRPKPAAAAPAEGSDRAPIPFRLRAARLLVVDRDLTVLMCNARFEQVFGRQPASMAVEQPGGFEVLRADGSPWPLPDRPLARALHHDEPTAEALMGLHRVCPRVRYLGSYPRADGLAPVPPAGTADRDFTAARRWLTELLEHGEPSE